MHTHRNKASLTKLIICLTPLVMALPFAMDIYVPAVPRITELFHVSAGTMQLTLNLFMLVSGISQLFFGPLTDWLGRKPITLLATALFTIGIVICEHAHNIQWLITGRIIQAVGSCGMMVLALAIARDHFEGRQLTKTYSFLNAVISLSPMLAPFIGSYLDLRYGWQATFEALLAISAATCLLYFPLLKESWPHSKRQPVSSRLITDYVIIAKDPVFYLYTLGAAMGLSYLFIFCAISPVIIITRLHIPEAHYGFYFCFMGASLFLGSLISGLIVEKIGTYQTFLVGFIISLIGGLVMLTWHMTNGLTINGFIWPMLLVGIGGTFTMSAGTGGAVTPFGNQAGLASALSSGFRFFYPALIGLIIAHHIHSTLPLAIPAIIQSVFGLMICLPNKKRLNN